MLVAIGNPVELTTTGGKIEIRSTGKKTKIKSEPDLQASGQMFSEAGGGHITKIAVGNLSCDFGSTKDEKLRVVIIDP